jgi:hypothetical protein
MKVNDAVALIDVLAWGGNYPKEILKIAREILVWYNAYLESVTIGSSGIYLFFFNREADKVAQVYFSRLFPESYEVRFYDVGAGIIPNSKYGSFRLTTSQQYCHLHKFLDDGIIREVA